MICGNSSGGGSTLDNRANALANALNSSGSTLDDRANALANALNKTGVQSLANPCTVGAFYLVSATGGALTNGGVLTQGTEAAITYWPQALSQVSNWLYRQTLRGGPIANLISQRTMTRRRPRYEAGVMQCSSVMVDGPTAPKKARSWSACPNCSRDLGANPIGSKPPHTYCPFCGVPLTYVWWQRILVTALGLILAYGVPASLGIRGIMTLLFAGLLCCYPALVLAIILIFKIIPPKYVRKSEAVTTLFHR